MSFKGLFFLMFVSVVSFADDADDLINQLDPADRPHIQKAELRLLLDEKKDNFSFADRPRIGALYDAMAVLSADDRLKVQSIKIEETARSKGFSLIEREPKIKIPASIDDISSGVIQVVRQTGEMNLSFQSGHFSPGADLVQVRGWLYGTTSESKPLNIGGHIPFYHQVRNPSHVQAQTPRVDVRALPPFCADFENEEVFLFFERNTANVAYPFIEGKILQQKIKNIYLFFDVGNEEGLDWANAHLIEFLTCLHSRSGNQTKLVSIRIDYRDFNNYHLGKLPALNAKLLSVLKKLADNKFLLANNLNMSFGTTLDSGKNNQIGYGAFLDFFEEERKRQVGLFALVKSVKLDINFMDFQADPRDEDAGTATPEQLGLEQLDWNIQGLSEYFKGLEKLTFVKLPPVLHAEMEKLASKYLPRVQLQIKGD